jgi:hypothetical protein
MDSGKSDLVFERGGPRHQELKRELRRVLALRYEAAVAEITDPDLVDQ